MVNRGVSGDRSPCETRRRLELLADGFGLRSDDGRGHSYLAKGLASMVRICNKRKNVLLISTGTNQGEVRCMVFDSSPYAKVIIRFVKRQINDAGRKILLILDNLRFHHGKVLREWLGKNTERIEVFFPPSNSPKPNPDECFNADLKQAVITKVPLRNESTPTFNTNHFAVRHEFDIPWPGQR